MKKVVIFFSQLGVDMKVISQNLLITYLLKMCKQKFKVSMLESNFMQMNFSSEFDLGQILKFTNKFLMFIFMIKL